MDASQLYHALTRLSMGKVIGLGLLIISLMACRIGQGVETPTQGGLGYSGLRSGRASPERRWKVIEREIREQEDLKRILSAEGLKLPGLGRQIPAELEYAWKRGWMAIFETEEGLDVYLNEAHFFTQGEVLTKAGLALIKGLYGLCVRLFPGDRVVFQIEAPKEKSSRSLIDALYREAGPSFQVQVGGKAPPFRPEEGDRLVRVVVVTANR